MDLKILAFGLFVIFLAVVIRGATAKSRTIKISKQNIQLTVLQRKGIVRLQYIDAEHKRSGMLETHIEDCSICMESAYNEQPYAEILECIFPGYSVTRMMLYLPEDTQIEYA